ncbi:hypothetical protein [Paenarthrobacter aurescens]|uniref:Uncharacterized protein n=1 Tax=Paenarthrobacter aurescens TaxID=43663 RepID=A0A4Y3NA04_PAEAU|nr:hypothetical protein [Paenarthrobacter aurescens]MDO6141662.1 hypothetical protein [Paenarthrobacter aurescens]MDO6149425.1 hypothetical protein [Paenarthrobacter aurescens]MDO6156711.1 hypothetical protein [Paenarthrobacter aurescens]MDO6160697.1 hypothetical protein [Paenarthrobacter aurescens]GEB18690.1 hypothetical protein AAU01_14450 [Paenarthrobacter aurescens]
MMDDEQLDAQLRRADPANKWAFEPETAHNVLRHLRAADEGQSMNKGRRRWISLLVAGAVAVAGAGVASPAVAQFMGFVTEEVENAPPVPSSSGDGTTGNLDIPDSRWINPLASDYARFAKTKYGSLPLPPGYDEERLKDASALKEAEMYQENNQGSGTITQDIAPTVRYEWVVRCLWEEEWLDRHSEGDQPGQVAAVSVLQKSLSWPATVATDGGGVVVRMKVSVAAAESGDAETVEEYHRTLGCLDLIKGLKQ